MGLAFSRIWERMFGKKEMRILMVGLDGHVRCGNQAVCRVHEEPASTPSSRRRVDGVEDDAMIQHERAVKS